MSSQKERFQKEKSQMERSQDEEAPQDRPLEKVVGEAICWANKAKDFERYEVSDRVFAVLLSLFENNEEKVRGRGLEAGVTVREDRRKSGKLSNGYRDLAWIVAGPRELCVPIPKLSRKYACWFYAHARRREEKEGQRETREGKEEEVETVKSGAGRAIEEIRSRCRITNPDHYLADRG